MKKIVFSVIGISIVIFILFLFLGSFFTNQYIDDQVEKIYAVPKGAEKFSLSDSADIPLIVSKYLDFAISDKNKIPTSAIVHQKALFKPSEESDFVNLNAVQYYSLKVPGFVWVAELKSAAIIPVKVIDSYIAGKGNMLVKIVSSITVADESGLEMDQSSLMRYFVEAPFIPYILLPSNKVKWSLIDHSTAKAELFENEKKYSMNVTFNQNGEIEKIFTEDRFRTTKVGYVKSGFTARFKNYKDFDGVKIPTYGEIEWNETKKNLLVGKFTIENVEFIW